MGIYILDIKMEKRGTQKMKIKITERTTAIEADARELRESQTLAQNVYGMLSRAFQNVESFDDDEDEDHGEEEE